MATRKDFEDELHRRFDGKPGTDYEVFVKRIGSGALTNALWKTDSEWLANNIKNLCNKADKFPEWTIKLCRALDLPTPDEASAITAKESLEAAKLSANAACDANVIAKGARLRSWIAIAIAGLALVVSAIQYFRGK